MTDNTREVLKQLYDALVEARDHLDYCGYGDKWESECARDQKIEEHIEAALDAAKKELSHVDKP